MTLETPENLMAYCLSHNVNVRMAVASHPSLPREAFELLSNDDSGHVQETVAANLNTPPDLLAMLGESKDWGVKYAVATNPNTPPETLHKLAEIGGYLIEEIVAENPNTSSETLVNCLAKTKRYSLCCIVLKHSNTPYNFWIDTWFKARTLP